MEKENEKMFFQLSLDDNKKIIEALNHFNSTNKVLLSRQKFLIHLAKQYLKQNNL